MNHIRYGRGMPTTLQSCGNLNSMRSNHGIICVIRAHGPYAPTRNKNLSSQDFGPERINYIWVIEIIYHSVEMHRIKQASEPPLEVLYTLVRVMFLKSKVA